MARRDYVPCQGYVFNGLLFERATVDSKDRVINAGNRTQIQMDPALMVWYTRREFQNAIAYCQARGTVAKDLDLNTVVPNKALIARLSDPDYGHLRTTRDHVLHMITAGVERVLGREFTPAERAEYERRADAYAARLNKAAAAAIAAVNAAQVA
jgi:hypothetical protein